MKTKFKSKAIFHLSLLFVFCLLPVSRPTTVSAEEVVLNPGFIEGAIQVGSETISQSDILASSTGGEGFSARTSIYPNASSGSYSLTVNVPAGTSIDYKVYPKTFLDDHRDYNRIPSSNCHGQRALYSNCGFYSTKPWLYQG